MAATTCSTKLCRQLPIMRQVEQVSLFSSATTSTAAAKAGKSWNVSQGWNARRTWFV